MTLVGGPEIEVRFTFAISAFSDSIRERTSSSGTQLQIFSGELLALDELLHPPVRIVVPTQIRDRPALTEKIVEVTLLLGFPNLPLGR